MDVQISCVARQPAESAPPSFVEVDGFNSPYGVRLTETLNQPEGLSFDILPRIQAPEITNRFFDLTAQATEIWMWDSFGNKVFAGPLLGYEPHKAGDELVWTITAEGILGYLKRMRIEPDGSDLVFAAEDQADIAAGLVDYYQALDYGDYGIDTSSIGATGVIRDRTYLAVEAHPIAQRLSELAAVEDGFDYRIDPTTRELILDYPFAGTDKTGSIIVDGRVIVDPSAQLSIGPEDVISDAFAVGDEGVVAHATNSDMREQLGRMSFASAFSGVVEASTLADHAMQMLTTRSTQLHVPPKTLYDIVLDWQDIVLGDLVTFSYDYGAGLMTEFRRVLTKEATIGPVTTISVGFL